MPILPRCLTMRSSKDWSSSATSNRSSPSVVIFRIPSQDGLVVTRPQGRVPATGYCPKPLEPPLPAYDGAASPYSVPSVPARPPVPWYGPSGAWAHGWRSPPALNGARPPVSGRGRSWGLLRAERCRGLFEAQDRGVGVVPHERSAHYPTLG